MDQPAEPGEGKAKRPAREGVTVVSVSSGSVTGGPPAPTKTSADARTAVTDRRALRLACSPAKPSIASA